MDRVLNFTAGETEAGTRLDKYLADMVEDLTRSAAVLLLEDGKVTVNKKSAAKNYKIKTGDEVEISIPEPVEYEAKAENIPLDIVYEDDSLLVVNKPKGMVVHPAAGHYSGTLVNALLYHCRDSLSGINGVLRPGIVHRIDMDTTGSLLVCKNDRAHRILAEQLKEHSIKRGYHAIVHGVIREEEGTVDIPIGRHPVDRKKMSTRTKNGRRAVTHYRVLERFRNYTYIACRLETGRTHQIRVHMAHIGHPLLGDRVYGPQKCPFSLEGKTPHPTTLGIVNPPPGECMEFDAPLPDIL